MLGNGLLMVRVGVGVGVGVIVIMLGVGRRLGCEGGGIVMEG